MPRQEKPYSQVEVIEALVESTGFEKKLVKTFLNNLGELAVSQLNMRGIGQITIPGLNIKMVVVKKPATKAHPGKNPFTGEAITVPAKPARKVIKIKAMKKLKDAVA